MIRGRRRLPAVFAGLLVIAALIWGGIWLNGARTYDALEAGSTFSGGPDGNFAQNFEGEDIFRKPFRPGAKTYFGVKILNGGDRDVKILSVGERDGLELVETGARMALREQRGTPEQKDVVAFAPFELKAGHERYVQLHYRMGGCVEWEPGTSHTVSSVPVRYRTAFFERTKHVDLREPVEIVRGQRDRCRR
jgi:hypothetical protein